MTPIEQVRLLIPDRDPADQVFTDIEIQEFLSLENNNVRAAAALALETAATNEALRLRVMRVGGDSVDGAAVARALLERARALRASAVAALSSNIAVAVIEQAHGLFGQRERLMNEILRDNR